MSDATSADLKKTPLYSEHIKANARMVPFAGWSMPVQYEGLKAEHEAVRQSVGLFDVSHMGEFRFKGPNALKTVEWLTTNHVAKLKEGQAQYSLLPNEKGGIVDDLIVYCLKENEDYLLCVNAANIDKDWDWVNKHNQGAELINESDRWAQIAIQGPNAFQLMDEFFGETVSDMAPFTFREIKNGILASTGYTGEQGFEYFIEKDHACEAWQKLLELGEKHQVRPIGLGARDTLRMEMKYSLYGQEITDDTNPYEAVLGWVVKAKDKDFIGKALIIAKKESGLSRKLIGFQLVDKGIARQGFKVVNEDGEAIGEVTSGTQSPSLGIAIGIAYVPQELSAIGTEFYIDIRGRKAKSLVVKTPFVQPK